MEVDDHHFCELLRMEPVAKMPDEELMGTEVAILTGGRDQSGRPLVTFPAQNYELLESRVKASGLDRILRYYIDVTSPTTKVHGFAFVADLRFSSLDFISMLKSSLNSLQAETTSVPGGFMLYLIQPVNKKSLKDTQTMLSLRSSRKKSNKNLAAPLFQATIVTDEMDLYNHVDNSQLTADLGGYLQYSHLAWIRFRKIVEPFFVRYDEMIPKLPDTFTRLEEMEGFDLGETRADLERQRDNVQQLLQELFRDVNIDAISDQCNDLLAKIRQSDSDETFAAVAQKPVFREVRLLAEYCREKLTMIQQRLDLARDRVEGRVQNEIKWLDLLSEIQNLCHWLRHDGPSSLKKLEIADSIGRAEMLSNHFETGVASLAEDKLAQASTLKEQSHTLMSEVPHGVADLRNAVRDLERHTEEYHRLLDDRRQLFSTVRCFYGLYDKIARWCVKTLKFLPRDIVNIHDYIRADRLRGRRHGDVGDTEVQWVDDVEGFLSRNRQPRDEDLVSMMENAETIGEQVRKKKAKHLYNRCTVLFRVLDTNELATNKDVLQALKWRSEIVGSHDDDAKEDTKRARRRGVTAKERRDGDGGEESRTDAEEKSEMESEVDDPLLQRLGQVKGQRLRRNSSKARERDGVDEGEVKDERKKREDDKVRRNESVKSQKESEDALKVERRDSRKREVGRKDSERRRKEETARSREEERELERRDSRKGEVRRKDSDRRRKEETTRSREEEQEVESCKAEDLKEPTESQWVRPSKDFWSGKIPGVLPSNSPRQNGHDVLDGAHGNMNTGIQGILGQQGNGIPNGTLRGMSPSNVPGMQGIPEQRHNIPNGTTGMQGIPGQLVNGIPSGAPANIPGLQGIPAQVYGIPNGTLQGHCIPNGTLQGPIPGQHVNGIPMSGYPLGNMDYGGLNSNVGVYGLNRNQNANPSPGVGSGNVVTQTNYAINGQPQYPHQGYVRTPSINQSHPSFIQMSQSPYSPAGFNQSQIASMQQPLQQSFIPTHVNGSHIMNGQYPQGVNMSATHQSGQPTNSLNTCTLYDPMTGLPYQAQLQSPQTVQSLSDRQSTGYLSDSQHSNTGSAYHNKQRLVTQNTGLPAHQPVVLPSQSQITSQDRMQALNIGLSSSRESHSGRSTPMSDHKRELSPYEDVMSRIGQLRVRAGRGERKREKSKTKAGKIHGAKSVPNLSNLLANVPVRTPEEISLENELGLNGDNQSDYYARLNQVDNDSRRSSRHATKRWVSRLVADDASFSDSYSLRSASPTLMESSSRKNQHRPLTPQEKYELESLTSLLNDSNDDLDDSAPVSNSPIRDSLGSNGGSFDQSHRRSRGIRHANIDFDADQDELDRIRQTLSGSYPEPVKSNFDADLESLQTSRSPDYYTSHISPLGHSTKLDALAHPHPISHNSHPAHQLTNHSPPSLHAATHSSLPYSTQSQSRVDPLHSGGVAPVTQQLRGYFGDVDGSEDRAVQEGLQERLRNIQLNHVEQHVSHDQLSTPNFLAEAMETLVKADSIDRHAQLGHVEARHALQRNPSLQFSDEGVIIDGASWDGTLEAGSVATTERESVESGVGSRGHGSYM